MIRISCFSLRTCVFLSLVCFLELLSSPGNHLIRVVSIFLCTCIFLSLVCFPKLLCSTGNRLIRVVCYLHVFASFPQLLHDPGIGLPELLNNSRKQTRGKKNTSMERFLIRIILTSPFMQFVKLHKGIPGQLLPKTLTKLPKLIPELPGCARSIKICLD